MLLGHGDDTNTATATVQRGNVDACVDLAGDAARECYAREVGRELAAVGGTGVTPQAVFTAPADSGSTVTFATAAAADTSAALLCDLHLRVGVTEADTPSWVSWNELPVS